MKKTNIKNNAGIALLAAGAIAASGIGTCLPGTAYATDATAADGQVVINPASSSTTSAYNAYQIFTATIDGTDNASSIAWANDATKTAVVNFLKGSTATRAKTYDAWIAESGYMRSSSVTDADREDPSNALGYINAEWGGTRNLVDTDHPAAGGFPQELAKAVAADSSTVKDEVAASTAWSGHGDTSGSGGAEGWYLFTTKTAGDGNMYTNAVFVPVGGRAHTITEKASPVTFTKEVKEDFTNNYGSVADAEVGSTVSYRLTFTLPGNYAEYSSYRLTFADTPATGLTIDPESIVVKCNSSLVDAAKYSKTGTSGTALAVAITDLKAVVPAAEAGNPVTVEYNATMNSSAATAPIANPNTAIVTYSNDPLSTGTGTKTSTAKVYKYAIKIHKTGEADIDLRGAKFKISQGSATGNCFFNSTTNTWTNAADSATEFTTNDAGVFNVSGLDANTTYYLTETEAPNQYALLQDPVTITLTPTYNSDGVLTSLEATPSSGSTVSVSTITVPQSGNPTGGEVELTIQNAKSPVTFALTGGFGPAIIVGSLIIVGGVALFVLSRKKDGEDAGK